MRSRGLTVKYTTSRNTEAESWQEEQEAVEDAEPTKAAAKPAAQATAMAAGAGTALAARGRPHNAT